MNKVCLTGRIASDIEHRTTQNGTSTCSFRIAVQRRYKDASGKYPADFLPVVAWRNTADFIHKYFIKGNMIGIEGSIQTRSYTAQDGSKRYVTEILAENAEFEGSANAQTAGETEQNNEFTPVEDDDLPF